MGLAVKDPPALLLHPVPGNTGDSQDQGSRGTHTGGLHEDPVFDG